MAVSPATPQKERIPLQKIALGPWLKFFLVTSVSDSLLNLPIDMDYGIKKYGNDSIFRQVA